MEPADFDFELPPAAIAQQPAARRGDARLLGVGRDGVNVDHVARELPSLLPEGALVVLNDSRVIPARLFGRRADGRSFELLVTAPRPTGVGARVEAWVRGGRRLRRGDTLEVGALVLRVCDDAGTARERSFEVCAGELMAACRVLGQVPLPPYIVRPEGATAADLERYQTVYADADGSVAAPTAGLHLEPDVLAQLDTVAIALHVGPGTFLPMDVADVRDHRVGAERVHVGEAAAVRIAQAQRAGRPIVAIGTTVVRALEHVARACGGIEPYDGATELVITPGHRFAAVTHLLTNFHLPRSSLLMLVCSFAGHARTMAAYREAVARGYRFYSYGDCMFVEAAP